MFLTQQHVYWITVCDLRRRHRENWICCDYGLRRILAKTGGTSWPQEGAPAPALLSKGMVKLPFLQAFESVCPGRGWHAPVRVQENPEAPDDEDAQENKQQNHKSKCGFLLQRHARIWKRVPKGHEGWRDRLSSIHCPGKAEHRIYQFPFLPSSVCWHHGGCTLGEIELSAERSRKGNN